MAEGRSMSAIVVVSLCMLVLCSDMAHAALFVVGGRDGWTTTVSSWTAQVYKAGDKLLFYYDPKKHNVVVVDQGGYNSCTAPAGAKTYNTGHDYIQLQKGSSYFISSIPGDCQAGTKVSVTVQ
ncbi:basic blue protein-like [Vigna unguiculata]|uniref:basic blue protein-like n=1 Tax=Vigna unguiculata TaxID=3917 RepID=UPI0010166B82|nr:basic blue protein-like [Vigna unguiculata]